LIGAGASLGRDLPADGAVPRSEALDPAEPESAVASGGAVEIDFAARTATPPRAETALAGAPAGTTGPSPATSERGRGGSTPPDVGGVTHSFEQMGELIEALEERLLSELERRGGRWAGVF